MASGGLVLLNALFWAISAVANFLYFKKVPSSVYPLRWLKLGYSLVSAYGAIYYFYILFHPALLHNPYNSISPNLALRPWLLLLAGLLAASAVFRFRNLR